MHHRLLSFSQLGSFLEREVGERLPKLFFYTKNSFVFDIVLNAIGN